jgi:hypothetical protein
MKSQQSMAMLVGALVVLTLWVAVPVAETWAGGQGSMVTGDPAPTAEQIQSLVARAVENQHRNDRAIEEFERIEHVISYKKEDNSLVRSDLTDRILPSGTGVMHLRVAQDGSPVSQDLYRRGLQSAIVALGIAIHPNDNWMRDLAKFDKRRRDRADLLDAATKAFRKTWGGRETRGSRTLVKVILDPDPDYKATSRFTAMFEHVHAVLWVDESQAQMVRLEGDVTTDITVGGGIVGKVYQGGHFVMEQAEIAPGVWLPTLYTYDLDGRKFIFGFGLHERTNVTRYRRVGPPAQSIELIRAELNNLSAQTPVP